MSSDNLVLRAVSFAARSHVGQFRKDGATPYVAHPMRVMTVMLTVFEVHDEEVLAAAVLHDTIEDTTADYDDLEEHFGGRVARCVAALSKDKRLPERDREEVYFAGLAEAPIEVKLCKLADTYDNLIDSAGLTIESRARTVQKADELLRVFGPGLPPEWRHVLTRTQEQIDNAEKMGGG